MKADEVVGQIREAYAKAKARPLPPVVLPEEPRQTAPREIIEEAPIELGYFHFAWHIPELRHPDVPVLDVLAVLLGSGRSSRLYQEVREKQGPGQLGGRLDLQPGQSRLVRPERHGGCRQVRRRARRHAGRSRADEGRAGCGGRN